MTHDPVCKWSTARRRPLDDDQPGCDECDIIAKARANERAKFLAGE